MTGAHVVEECSELEEFRPQIDIREWREAHGRGAMNGDRKEEEEEEEEVDEYKVFFFRVFNFLASHGL